MNLQELGFTKKELQERLIDKLCSEVMSGVAWDEDGNEFERNSKFAQKINARIEKQIEATIDKLAKKHVLPNVSKYIEDLCLQKTNEWGEKKGAPVSFIEYLVQRADAYMREEVNHEGKTQKEDSYSFRKCGTRIAYMVDKHLQYSIERAMKEALQNANSSIAKGLEEAVKIKLKEVTDSLNVKVTTK